ncbi:YggS family pyridoxal phosphate-dependent enzyme [Nocardioides terrisoli]|uniref:YggS family pyridoxal phosphate-dependent enzyme n=1 Tax=Nocardioides terrisoli TaxID=3388267 RepID=UPI00287B8DD3|nr:YggS family pyridoxal phosphate-dependent enzyme [Nocardioides marmorisolisilvae]
MSAADARRDELSGNLAAVRRRIADACGQAGRDPGEITLVVVTKFFPASDVRLLAELDVRHLGENRHQEAEPKAAACADLTDLVWHFIGGLQSNKAAAVARYADVVESVDRVKLVRPLARGAQERGHPLDVLLQVSLDPPDAGNRNGVDPREVAGLAEAVLATDELRLRGVMAVAPLGQPPVPAFERLAQIAASVRALAPGADRISAGMSSDLEEAVKCGATHVRIGSAILGNRPPIK